MLKELFVNLRDEFQTFIDCMTDAVFVMQVSEDGFIYVAVNKEGKSRANITEDVIGKSLFDVLPEDVAAILHEQYEETCVENRPMSYEFKRINGCVDESILSPITYKSNKVEFVLCITRDITKKKLYEEYVGHMAFHDALTGLPNRNMFNRKLEEEYLRYIETKDPFTIMYLDFDDFKQVNDRFGHEAGDELLREFAIRLKKCMRSKDTIARIGGDEFTVLLPTLKDEEQVNAIALRMIHSMDEPWVYEDEKVFVTISIGLTWSDENSNLAEMLKRADQALYKTKNHGKNNFTWYEADNG
ncbi:hypothetical protein CR203_16790 [Salipaludibacillus neizhouensis]|uniref:GGDEF domain-containing protein n=1 Tax=Salipaludibacillus neizhouensis TaxID=885475 RepID=A0A3A9K5R5_9BACI|nr:diguanylate cyclase [Salipaludibacillus neizhouensis]RKL66210.1 hypothetical protein CR203_16790 [Salipaludibacillus neizhouensis]